MWNDFISWTYDFFSGKDNEDIVENSDYSEPSDKFEEDTAEHFAEVAKQARTKILKEFKEKIFRNINYLSTCGQNITDEFVPRAISDEDLEQLQKELENKGFYVKLKGGSYGCDRYIRISW